MNQTPFQKLAAELTLQARTEPLAAFTRIQECHPLCQTDEEVRQLCALATNLGGAALGRWDDVLTFLETLQEHPALQRGGDTERSILRAAAVMQRCAGRHDRADEAIALGVRSPADRVRVEINTAQILASRGRITDATPYLQAATTALAHVSADDEIVGQMALMSLHIQKAAEQRIEVLRSVMLAASKAQQAAYGMSSDWHVLHKSAYHVAEAELCAGHPREALAQVQRMMELEDAHNAGPAERFFTASLACRAQLLRGQMRVAEAALEASRDYAARVQGELRPQVDTALRSLEQTFAG